MDNPWIFPAAAGKMQESTRYEGMSLMGEINVLLDGLEEQDFSQPAQPARPPLTDQQLRALSRKHLILMLRDQEQEIQQLKRERRDLLMAYQAGLRI